MEPSGRNQWRPVASARLSRAAQTSQNRCRGLRRVATGGGGRRFESDRGLRLIACSASLPVVCSGEMWSLRRPPSVHERPPRLPGGRRAAGLRARGRRGRGGRSGGRSWSGSHPCSGRGRRWRCRHGARRSRRCAGDRRCAGTDRFRQRAGPASSRGRRGAGRGSRRGARTRSGRRGPERGRARRADRRARWSPPSRRG